MSAIDHKPELPAGAQGFLSPDGSPAKAFATFVVTSDGTQAQWTFANDNWPSVDQFDLVHVPSGGTMPTLPSGTTQTVGNHKFSGPGTSISSKTNLFLTEPPEGQPRFLVQAQEADSVVTLTWYTNSHSTDWLPTSTLTFKKAGHPPTNNSFYAATDAD